MTLPRGFFGRIGNLACLFVVLPLAFSVPLGLTTGLRLQRNMP
jgi:hypothetical protein